MTKRSTDKNAFCTTGGRRNSLWLLHQRFCAVLLAVMTFLLALPGVCRAAQTETDWLLADTARCVLQMSPEPSVGSVGGEWAVLGLARSGEKVPPGTFERYYENVTRYFESLGEKGLSKSTDASRIVLALCAIGKDPQKAGGSSFDLLSVLSDYDFAVKQGGNGAAFALIALDCRDFAIPQKTGTSDVRGKIVFYLLEKQKKDGGWALDVSQSASDPDLTAMVLTALSRYRGREDVDGAVNRALSFLSAQCSSGAIGKNSESLSQLITALCELGISPRSERFRIGKTDCFTMLSGYYVKGKGFLHEKQDKNVNKMSTEQALYALASLSRFEKGKNSLYSMQSETGGFCLSRAFAERYGEGKRTFESTGKKFADIAGRECEKAVLVLSSENIVKGKTSERFDPSESITRAEFAALLVRGLGLTERSTDVFRDVRKDDWFCGSVGAAYRAGLIKGVSSDRFDPNGRITLAQMSAMLARAARSCGADTLRESVRSGTILGFYCDAGSIPAYAKDDFAFCLYGGLLCGKDGRLRAEEEATRGEAAVSLYMLLLAAGKI